jgi:uncharacterized integral membrane protein
VNAQQHASASEFRMSLFLAWSCALPVIVGIVTPWLLVLPALIVVIAVTSRVTRVNEIRRRERGELG